MVEDFKPDEYIIMSNASTEIVSGIVSNLGYEKGGYGCTSDFDYVRDGVVISVSEPFEEDREDYISTFREDNYFISDPKTIITYDVFDDLQASPLSGSSFEEDLDPFNSPLVDGLEALLSGDEEEMEEFSKGLKIDEDRIKRVGKDFRKLAGELRDKGYESHLYGVKELEDNRREYRTLN